MKTAKLAAVVVILAAAGAVLYFKYAQTSSAADQVRREIVEFLPKLKDYDKHRQTISGWIDAAHQAAATAGNAAGGFDEDAYVASFFETLCEKARSGGDKALEENLHVLSVEFDNHSASRGP